MGLYEIVLSRSDAPSPTFREFLFLSGLDENKVVYDVSNLHILSYYANMVHDQYPPTSADDLGLGIYRPVFLDAVVGLLDPSIVHFNKRCVSVTSTENTTVINFTDGTKHEADVVIGADGIRSVTRNHVVGEGVQKHMMFTNTIAYRGLIPLEDLKAAGLQTELSTRPIMFVGLDKVCFELAFFSILHCSWHF